MEAAQFRLVSQFEQRLGEQGMTKLDQLTTTSDETCERVFKANSRRLDRAAHQREPDESVRSGPVETLDASSERVEQRQ